MKDVRILIVEDEGITAMDTSEQLQSLGYIAPAIAFSGKEALRKVEELRPDVVLMDIRLKGKMDGVETAAEIRARFAIPVIYVTAYADDATLQRAKVTEPFGYILKPFEERTLHSTLEMALYRHKLEHQRTEFLALLSHDIRSPLSVILGYAEMLEEEIEKGGATEAKTLLQRLTSTAQTVHALVANYLDLSRIEAGQLTLTKEQVDLNGLLLRTVRQYEAEAQRRRLTLAVDLQPTLPLVTLDVLAIERVVTNLLSNALKFTPGGGAVTVRSALQECEVVIAVSDTGPGVAAEEAPFLFDKYHTARVTRGRESTGLGLFIVKTFVEAHGGRVRVESIPGQGACFSVILPIG